MRALTYFKPLVSPYARVETDHSAFQIRNAGQSWRLPVDLIDKGIDLAGIPLGLNNHTGGTVSHKPAHAMFLRQTVHKRPETDSLDDTGNLDSLKFEIRIADYRHGPTMTPMIDFAPQYNRGCSTPQAKSPVVRSGGLESH